MNEPTDDEREDESTHLCQCRECLCWRKLRGSDVLCQSCRDGDHDNQSVEGEI
jgi:hypothetical protein